jgi:hypothetical protein
LAKGLRIKHGEKDDKTEVGIEAIDEGGGCP